MARSKQDYSHNEPLSHIDMYSSTNKASVYSYKSLLHAAFKYSYKSSDLMH